MKVYRGIMTMLLIVESLVTAAYYKDFPWLIIACIIVFIAYFVGVTASMGISMKINERRKKHE